MKKQYSGWIKEDTETDAIYLTNDGRYGPLAQILEKDISGKNVSVRYYITDKECSLEEASEEFTMKILGMADSKFSAHYSELTGFLYADEEINIGGHNLLERLRSNVGKYLILEIEIHLPKACSMEIIVDGWKYVTDPNYETNAGRIVVSRPTEEDTEEGFDWRSPKPCLGEYFGSKISFDPVNQVFAVGCKGTDRLGTGESQIIFYDKNREPIGVIKKSFKKDIRNFGCKFMFSKDGKYFISLANLHSRKDIHIEIFIVDWENKSLTKFLDAIETLEDKPNIRDVILGLRIVSPTEIVVQIENKVITYTQSFQPH